MATGTWADKGNVIKWSQPPDMEFGVNIASTEDYQTFIVADDWQCLDPRPVTDVHFWGSYIGWQENIPDPDLPPPGVFGFVIRIYKDVPAGVPPSYSHPGEKIYEATIIGSFTEDYVISIKHPGEPVTFEHKFYYSLDLPEAFLQEEGAIYWISISAIMPENYQYPWGWETSEIHWNDNACKYNYIEQMWIEITPGALPNWYPHRNVDMAFELSVFYEVPPPLEPIKWQQRPDMERGVNIVSAPFNDIGTVADDWLCLDGSPISDLHFWGSYPGWMEDEPDPPTVSPPGVEAFRIQVYSDVPASGANQYSHPGKLLYEIRVDNFTETYLASILLPWQKYEHKYRYDLDLSRMFWQKQDRIYWLNISAIPKVNEFLWGWESSMDRWNDFAVKGWYQDPDNYWWNMIVYPFTEDHIDMSFELTTCEGPIKWLQFPDMADGRNIISMPIEPIVADDFLCTNGKPITEVRFWGSYLSPAGDMHWEQANPGPPASTLPPTPGVEKFKLSFHKDIPAGADPEMLWSHPGELIRNVWIDSDQVIERYWDSIPHTDHTGLTWWEHKFYYIIRLTEELGGPFDQEEGIIYWLDVGARPNIQSNWFWGWETSRDHWNDNAVRDNNASGYWENLGNVYHERIDMAFLLITPDDTPYCKGDFNRDGDVDGSDLALLAADFGRIDCYYTGDCEGDFDYNGEVKLPDLSVFAPEYSRSDCPCGL